MKRIICVIVTITMLAGMCITAGAALDGAVEYVIDETTTISEDTSKTVAQYVVGSKFSGFRNGDGLPGKTGDFVYEMTYTGTNGQLMLKPADHTYSDGEKVHMSTEIMIPDGSFAGLSQNEAPGIALKIIDENGAERAIAVKNNGHQETGYNYRNYLIGFNTYSKRFILFGNSVYTNQKWEYDRWYRIDVVLVMGSNPKVAVYIDGNPLTINPDHKNGTDYHKDNSDATFDGFKTSTDYIDIGYHDESLNYVTTAVKGVKQFYLNTTNPDGKYFTMYADNIFYKPLAANETPDIPAPLSIAGIANGATLEHDELKALNVNVPLWNKEAVSKVSLSVDGAEALVETTAPYAFDLRGIDRGVRNITLTTYDSNDIVLNTANQSIVVAGNEKITRVDEEFNGAILEGAFYGLSTRQSELSDSKNITNEQITDSDGVHYGDSVKLFSKNSVSNSAKVMYGWGPNIGVDDWENRWPSYTDGLVKVSYDMYIDNNDIEMLRLSHHHDGTYKFVKYDNTASKFVTYSNEYGLTEDKSFDVDVKKWQKWNWIFDYDKGNVTLKIGDEIKLNKVSMQQSPKNNGFDAWTFEFSSANVDGNYIGIDNFKVTKENGINHVFDNGKTLSFTNSENYSDTAKSHTVNDTKYMPQYGKKVIEYDFRLDNTSYTNVTFKLKTARLWRFVAADNKVNFGVSGTGEKTNATLKHGEWQKHKLVIYPNPDSTKPNPYFQFYVDGVLIYDGPTGYAYTESYNEAYNVSWEMKGAADTADSSKYADNQLELANINISYEAISPVITSVTFADGLEKDGKVLSNATGFTVNVPGKGISLDDKLTVKEVGSEESLGSVTVNGNTVEVSNLNLEVGKTYKVELASAIAYDYETKYSTKYASTYLFDAVESLDVAAIPSDGVDDDITVTDMRFTTNARSVINDPVATYTGGIIYENYRLRADVKVNNNSADKKTFRALIATYVDGELTDIALGREYTLNAYAEDCVITTGAIIMNEDAMPDIKVILVQDMEHMIPVSSSLELNN